MKQFTKGFKALPDFDIGKLYVRRITEQQGTGEERFD